MRTIHRSQIYSSEYEYPYPHRSTGPLPGASRELVLSRALDQNLWSRTLRAHLVPPLVHQQVALQLGAVVEAAAALGAAEAGLRLLVPVLDVLRQGAAALVAAGAVRTGEQLGEGVGGSWGQRGGHSSRGGRHGAPITERPSPWAMPSCDWPSQPRCR